MASPPQIDNGGASAGGRTDRIDIYRTLTDFEFLEAKCTHVAVATQKKGEAERKMYGGVYELQEDYRYVLERFPPM